MSRSRLPPQSHPDPAPQQAPEVTAPPRDELAAPDSRYFGLYTAQAPFNFGSFDDAASKVGVQPGIVGYFGGWDQTFRADVVKKAWARGMLPLLTWESRPINAPNSAAVDPEYSLPRIIGDPAAGVPGAFDDYLRQYARDIAATGLPLAIRLDHEMNGSWYPWRRGDVRRQAAQRQSPGRLRDDVAARPRHLRRRRAPTST